MSKGFEIRGGADEFQAAIVAVTLDHIAEQENASANEKKSDARLPLWIRAERETPPVQPHDEQSEGWS